MRIVRTIAAKEFLECWRDGRLRAAAAAILILLVASLLVSTQQYMSVRAERESANVHDREQWLAQGDRNPHSAAHFGRYAFKPSNALSFIDQGVNSYLGIAVWLEAHYQNPFRYRPAEDANAIQRFGNLSVAIVLQLLLPLLIVLLTFPAFAGEKDAGTLKQLLSLGVSPADLATGKLLGLGGTLAVVLAPAIIIGVAALAVASGADSPSTIAGRGLVLAFFYALYFAVFFGLGVAVSSISRSAPIALLVLLGFWAASSFIAPRAAADFAQAIHPSPSYVEFWKQVNQDISQGIDGHDPADKRREGLKHALLARYHVSRVEDLPLNFDGWMLQAGEEYSNTIFDQHYAQLWNSFEQQDRTSALFGIVSPFVAIRNMSMGFAGTDFQHHRDFATQAEQYRRVINRMMNGDLTYHSRTGQGDYTANASLWKQLPEFSYQTPSLAWVLSRQNLNLGMLLGWFLFANGTAWMAVRRLRPE